MPSQLSTDALPAWAHLNNVSFTDIQLKNIQGKGFGLTASCQAPHPSSSAESGESETLLKVPRDLILSAKAVEDYAKVDRNFRQLLDKAGHRSPRGDILLYLLLHLILPARAQSQGLSVAPTAWTEYIKFLPRPIPVPTQWSDRERSLLQGTSLESAIDAKLAALTREFEELHEISNGLPFWNSLLWEKETVTIEDWILADAWYRSRCLELPRSGDSMVPMLDMANHSHEPNAYYEENNDGDVLLIPRSGQIISTGDEVAISYGESKSAAEMLFSYGFIDQHSSTQEMTMPISSFPDDPLAQAKLHIFNGKPTVRIARTEETLVWVCPFIHLMVLNEEDGLDFRVLQDTAGGRQLKVFWQDEDVSEKVDEFESLTQDHPYYLVFQLRSITVLKELLNTQLVRIQGTPTPEQIRSERSSESRQVREQCRQTADTLRRAETSLLKDAVESLEKQQAILLVDDQVKTYLGLSDGNENDQAQSSMTNEEPDFS